MRNSCDILPKEHLTEPLCDHRAEFGKWFSGHMQTPLILPEAIISLVLPDLITGLSPHLHFQKSLTIKTRIQSDQVGVGGTILWITPQKWSPNFPVHFLAPGVRREGWQALGSYCPEVGSSLYVRRTSISWHSALGCICLRDISISGIEQCRELYPQ